jgi:hypothetical protein
VVFLSIRTGRALELSIAVENCSADMAVSADIAVYPCISVVLCKTVYFMSIYARQCMHVAEEDCFLYVRPYEYLS